MDYLDFRRRCFSSWKCQFQILCGSSHELPIKYTNANQSDVDVMIYRYDICAIPFNRRPPKNFKGQLLIIESNSTVPGFAKLKSYQDMKRNECVYFRRPQELNIYGKYGTNGPSIEGISTFSGYPGIESNVQIFAGVPGYPEGRKVDMVSAVYCPYWPLEAEEWRTRKRNHGWPDENLITRIARGGCHFVSKPRVESSFDDTEWRFSFSKAELILIHSWTEVQKSVYHFIRVIMRTVKTFAKDENEAFQTYFFKTLMLWACEQSPREYWTEENIETCVLGILGRMVECLIDQHCPSYFIPACNIMGHLKNIDLMKEIELLVDCIEKHATSIISRNLSILGKKEKEFIESLLSGNKSIDLFCDGYVMELDRVLEIFLADAINHVNPFNSELNGHLGEYLYECECFLPEMKFLHSSIKANVRLMSIESTTAREESEHYATFLQNMNLSLNSNRCTEYVWYSSLSYLENLNHILLKRLFHVNVEYFEDMDQFLLKKEFHENMIYKVKQKDQIYLSFKLQKCPEQEKQCSNSPKTSCLNFEIWCSRYGIERLNSVPSPLEGIITAYKANFYFTALHSYDLALNECVDFLENGDKMQLFDNAADYRFPFLISTKLSPIYDEHIKVILGFAALVKAVTSQNPLIPVETCLEVCPKRLILYLSIQCHRKFRPITTVYIPSKVIHSPTPGLSHLGCVEPFSDRVFYAALHQSGASIYSVKTDELLDPSVLNGLDPFVSRFLSFSTQ